MRAEDVQVNLYVPMTEIAREKKTSSPKYLIQSWMRSNTTIEYGYGKRSITLNLKFKKAACDELELYGTHHQHHTDTLAVDQYYSCIGNENKLRQRWRNNCASINRVNVSCMGFP